MDNNRSFGFAMFKLYLMSLSLTIPLIIIGASGWIIALITIAVFASALSGREGIAMIYRQLHNIILRPGLYIWALVVAIKGPQDFFAIGFYIVAALQALNIIRNFIGEILLLIASLQDS